MDEQFRLRDCEGYEVHFDEIGPPYRTAAVSQSTCLRGGAVFVPFHRKPALRSVDEWCKMHYA